MKPIAEIDITPVAWGMSQSGAKRCGKDQYCALQGVHTNAWRS